MPKNTDNEFTFSVEDNEYVMIILVTVNREFSEEVGSPNLFGDNPLPPLEGGFPQQVEVARHEAI